MPFSFPARSKTENCPTRAIMSAHAEQKIQREINPGTADRSGGELHQHRRRTALLTDSLVWGHARPYQPEAQAIRHRHVTLQAGGPEQGKAERVATRCGTGSGRPLTRVGAAEATHVAPRTSGERRVVHLRGMWRRGRVERQTDSLARGSCQRGLAGQQEGEPSLSLSELPLADSDIRW